MEPWYPCMVQSANGFTPCHASQSENESQFLNNMQKCFAFYIFLIMNIKNSQNFNEYIHVLCKLKLPIQKKISITFLISEKLSGFVGNTSMADFFVLL